MNTLNIDLKTIPSTETLELDGISFSGISYLIPYIDGISILNTPVFSDSFMVYKELLKSSANSGHFLIFTSISGIADDAGWSLVKVGHTSDYIYWTIQRDYKTLNYKFEKTYYLNSITTLEKLIDSLPSNIELEPKYVIYPEEG